MEEADIKDLGEKALVGLMSPGGEMHGEGYTTTQMNKKQATMISKEGKYYTRWDNVTVCTSVSKKSIRKQTVMVKSYVDLQGFTNYLRYH